MAERQASERDRGEILTAVRFIWNHPANRGRRLRKLAEAAVFQARGRLLGKPSIARIGERSRLVVYPGRGQAGLLYANPTEWPEIQCWRRSLARGGLFIDVGANVGAYTLWAIELGCDVIAVEPDPASADALEQNLRLNGYTAEIVRAALADAPGTARFTTSLGVLNHLVRDATTEAVREVPATTLDELLGERAAAGVKIDVEGAELLVLQGASRALAEGRIGLLQLEWNSCSETLLGSERAEVATLLRGFGYALYRPDHEGALHPIEHEGAGPDVFARRG